MTTITPDNRLLNVFYGIMYLCIVLIAMAILAYIMSPDGRQRFQKDSSIALSDTITIPVMSDSTATRIVISMPDNVYESITILLKDDASDINMANEYLANKEYYDALDEDIVKPRTKL